MSPPQIRGLSALFRIFSVASRLREFSLCPCGLGSRTPEGHGRTLASNPSPFPFKKLSLAGEPCNSTIVCHLGFLCHGPLPYKTLFLISSTRIIHTHRDLYFWCLSTKKILYWFSAVWLKFCLFPGWTSLGAMSSSCRTWKPVTVRLLMNTEKW